MDDSFSVDILIITAGCLLIYLTGVISIYLLTNKYAKEAYDNRGLVEKINFENSYIITASLAIIFIIVGFMTTSFRHRRVEMNKFELRKPQTEVVVDSTYNDELIEQLQCQKDSLEFELNKHLNK